MMLLGQHPKLPLLMRAMEGEWWENSDLISGVEMKETESLGLLGKWVMELWSVPFMVELW